MMSLRILHIIFVLIPYSKNFLNKRLGNFRDIISEHAPTDVPVMLLMDNVNMYRGNKRHQQLFKGQSPTMWNFTVRGAIIPNCNGIQHLLNNPETSQEPQRQLSLLKAEDLFIGLYSNNFKKECLGFMLSVLW